MISAEMVSSAIRVQTVNSPEMQEAVRKWSGMQEVTVLENVDRPLFCIFQNAVCKHH